MPDRKSRRTPPPPAPPSPAARAYAALSPAERAEVDALAAAWVSALLASPERGGGAIEPPVRAGPAPGRPAPAKPRAEVEPLPIGKAARLVGRSVRTVSRLLSAGVLTQARPAADRGPGRSRLLWADEVEVLRTEGEAACREYRRLKGRD